MKLERHFGDGTRVQGFEIHRSQIPQPQEFNFITNLSIKPTNWKLLQITEKLWN